MFIFKPRTSEKFSKIAWYEGAFTPGECQKIIALMQVENTISASVSDATNVDHSIRNSQVTWINYSESQRWIWDRLEKYIRLVNSNRYNFQLAGLLEALQLTRYDENGFYTWHEDNTEPTHSTRKLSLSVQLTAPDDYEAGELVIFPNFRAPRTQGTISFFPSFVTHKVEPVKKGVRHSLVAWVTGDPFR